MKEIIKNIKPQENGVSNKYSWNFYKFLNNNKKVLDGMKIYYNPICFVNGDYVEYDINNINTTHINISFNGISSFSLSSILMKGKSQELYCGDLVDDWIEITDEFMNTYINIGRCLFDSSHKGWLLYDKDRLLDKKCTWCGKEV